MRYMLVITDGEAVLHGADAADGHDLFDALDGAETPGLDAMGRLGRVGVAATSPGGMCSFAHGVLSLLGYGPETIASLSPAVIDAAATGEDLGDGDWVVRVGLVSVSDEDGEGLMHGHGPASDDETRAVFDDLIARWRETGGVRMERVKIVGTGGERMLIDRGQEAQGPGYAGVEMVDPDSIVGERWVEHLPDGGARGGPAAFLCGLISESRHFLAEHPVNAARREQGLGAVNLAWAWDAGSAGGLVALPHRVRTGGGVERGPVGGVRIVTDCDRGVGLARLMGCPHTRVADPLGLTAAAVGPGPGEAGLGTAGTELTVVLTDRGIEAVDREIVGPLLEALSGRATGELEDVDDALWRVLVAVSHDPVGASGIGGGMSPFVLAGGRVRSVVDRRLSGAMGSDLRVDPASELLEYVLNAGLRGMDRGG